ncbi:RNA polymerase factor sigma-54 [Ligilactobacillus sp. LYQ135]
MKFSQNLNQNQVQKLAMTQQMQQSIRLLKATTDELHSYLKQKELENPFIEVSTFAPSSDTQVDFTQFAANMHQQSLDDYLLDQVHLTMRDTPIRTMVIYLIENLDDNGYLNLNFNDLYEKQKFDKVLVEDALTLLQQLDPPGIGARNLQECLLLQTESDDFAPVLAYPILKNDFADFTEKKWDKIAKKYHTTTAEIEKILIYVRTLSPAPGAMYQNNETEYLYPDLIVKVTEGTIELKSTKYAQPQVTFKQNYFNSFANNQSGELQKFLKDKKAEYTQITTQVHQRTNTIFKVGKAIVEQQLEFFTNENHPLKPLLLRDIAQKLQLHESTVSRAVNGKYLKTDFGIYELKSFFTSAVHYAEDQNLSANDVQTQIQTLINNENKKQPLSDQKIVDLLKAKEIKLSRRTVAKYRTKLGIPSSSKRKIL